MNLSNSFSIKTGTKLPNYLRNSANGTNGFSYLFLLRLPFRTIGWLLEAFVINLEESKAHAVSHCLSIYLVIISLIGVKFATTLSFPCFGFCRVRAFSKCRIPKPAPQCNILKRNQTWEFGNDTIILENFKKKMFNFMCHINKSFSVTLQINLFKEWNLITFVQRHVSHK